MTYENDYDEVVRINARDTDAFDIANIRHYIGPNPYLDSEALVFDFALTGQPLPLSLTELQAKAAEQFPSLRLPPSSREHTADYATLFARTVSEAGRLKMGLHLDKWSVKHLDRLDRIAVQTLHMGTQKSSLYFVWDWFEALNQDEEFDFDARLIELQEGFSDSVYGGPSTYALLRAAYKRGIPTTYLWDEGLVQYGYGSRQVRGASTTFDRDSQLDSDFTTRKDDCKLFLEEYGFPVPHGEVVEAIDEALDTAERIGYPVVVKPLSGHKGIGVTANIQDPEELEFAFEKAAETIHEEGPPAIIVEKFVTGHDYRLLCVDGDFAAAVKREAAWVIGDGRATIMQLIDCENATPERADTPTSPLGKIVIDDSMENYLREQKLDVDSVLRDGEKVHLRKVANLSAGGVSENVTDSVHPDTVAMCRTIAQQFRLTCMGVDVLTDDISRSWQEGNFGIIEINAAPGIFMHLNPAKGSPVDVPSRIIETFFTRGEDARIPILTFNTLNKAELRRILDFILNLDITLNPGGVCHETLYLRRDELPLQPDYNSNVRNLLRNPKLDMLVAECPAEVYEEEGQYYAGSDLVVLQEPSELERSLALSVKSDGVVMIREGLEVVIKSADRVDTQSLSMADEFTSLYLRQIKHLCEHS